MAANMRPTDYTNNVVIDPMTRIEGHLRIQATAVPIKDMKNKDGKDKDGKHGYRIETAGLSSSTMVRGFEIIMKDRDPREAWAFAQRICGVCTVVHGLTSLRAVEKAAGITVPKNADYIRNLMIGAQYVHDHVMHFYHLHALDWVDVVSALRANPAGTAALAKKNNPNHLPNSGKLPDKTYFQTILDQLNGLVARKQLGLFSNGFGGHPAYKLRPEENLLLVSHYLDALNWAPDAVLIHAVCGGKDPHPDLLVGGMQYPFSSDDFKDPPRPEDPPKPEDPFYRFIDPLYPDNPKWQVIVERSISRMRYFVDNVYLPDVVLAATAYKDWTNYGGTYGNFLCFGDFPDPDFGQNDAPFTVGAIDHPEGFLMPPGVIWKGDITKLEDFKEELVTENVVHAWYEDSSKVNLHPYEGETKLHYTGPPPDQSGYMLDEGKKYSWMKSPRYDGKPVEVGPLAHVLMMHARNTLPTDAIVRKMGAHLLDRCAQASVREAQFHAGTDLLPGARNQGHRRQIGGLEKRAREESVGRVLQPRDRAAAEGFRRQIRPWLRLYRSAAWCAGPLGELKEEGGQSCNRQFPMHRGKPLECRATWGKSRARSLRAVAARTRAVRPPTTAGSPQNNSQL